MSKPQLDDFQAVRAVVETLEPFAVDDRERIIRWAREKLGMASQQLNPMVSMPTLNAGPGSLEIQGRAENVSRQVKDIKTFINEKDPKSDRQLAATVAFYYAFEAPQSERKDAIGTQDLIDACRKAGVRRPTNPGQTLRNTAHAGYLDKASERGEYKLNSVGENLVAMVLPGGSGDGAAILRKRKPRAAKKKK